MMVSKEHAAIAQLETAIWLYFEDKDPISVHTLANAAGEALDGCCTAAGQESMWAAFRNHIKPEFWEEIRNKIREPYNHFKHSSNAHQSIYFTDDQNVFFLFRACMNARTLSFDSDFCGIFITWLAAVEPQWLLQLPDPNGAIRAAYGDILLLPREVQKGRGRAIIEITKRTFQS
ncbi:hypothetical protein [Lichenibacterium ramalinae]|uniref:hypothetical protein n=1 Tax=Lichenibacterium ramalinae TaxID=2316527 RepID=UPI00100E4B8B|nr:hypothetical protein [Lichenibacterium ramalinae]